ncbi:hypothetical protein [Chroococcidiopsis thermalis]|uniref:Uncharacterized protein n=1 Tax=Chroococcidiopsis thermalis (strain PCC 7203) TaxID=251229 RepID=K9U8X5_CHRTP|nr:hypothetical protein [Chroococcidiopsis thermalis]AFY90886.1 hypothetical protein Chro_5528 [Chroococcidiopsis thermalis PCC 7203]PSB45269.1 hypothetical protein C7B80_17710 [Cyanosarcina cf. burmensis CCALA 770]
MLDNRFSFADEQLFAELTPEEGAAISGGYNYKIWNDANRKIYVTTFDANGITTRRSIDPQKQLDFSSPYDKTYLIRDTLEGKDYAPELTQLDPEIVYRLEVVGNKLELHQGFSFISQQP